MRELLRVMAVASALVAAFCLTALAQDANPYFTGDGGRGIRLAVLEPSGGGLSADDYWMLPLVQGSITGDFNKYSGMTIIDRQNLEKVIGEWKEAASGKYSDEDYVKIGNLTNASHILTGNINKTPSAIVIDFSVTDLQSGVRKASYSPKPVSLFALENLSAIKEASADLLRQLGVELTGAALAELRQTENMAKVQAETMLARGISAQKQGTEIAALSYFFQAAILDPSLAEAINRSSVMAANVSSGNIGDDTRNDIAWRKSWVKRLEEAERYVDRLNKTVSMPYTLFYSDEIIRGKIDYDNETTSMTIKTNLNGSNGIKVWALSVEKALQAVYDGLEATGRKETWELYWPGSGVTNLSAFERQGKEFAIVVELVNSRGKVIGKQNFEVSGYWEYDTYRRPQVNVSSDRRKDVEFSDVKADDITDNLTIRFASVNGETAGVAAKKGILQIKAMRKDEFDNNELFRFEFGEIKGHRKGSGDLVIPNTIWDNPVVSIAEGAFNRWNGDKFTGITIPNTVTFIGKGAFANNQLASVNIPSSLTFIGAEAFESNQLTDVTIPNGVTYIRKSAFQNNKLTSVVIPNSVTSIEENAFAIERRYNPITSVTIGENVSFGRNAFGDGFEESYQIAGRRAGTYTRASTGSSNWARQMTHIEQEDLVQQRRQHEEELRERRAALSGDAAPQFAEPQTYPALSGGGISNGRWEAKRSEDQVLSRQQQEEELRQRHARLSGSAGSRPAAQAAPARADYSAKRKSTSTLSQGLLYGGLGALFITEQQSYPLYDPFCFAGSFGFGLGVGGNFHIGVNYEPAMFLKIRDDVLSERVADESVKMDSLRFHKVNLFARLYLGNSVYLTGGAGVWLHGDYAADVNTGYGGGRVTVADSEIAPLFTAGIGFVVYYDDRKGFVFDSQYSVLPGKGTLRGYLTVTVGMQMGGRVAQ